MLLPRLVASMLSPGMLATATAPERGRNYPAKTVRMVTAGPGGGSGFAARQECFSEGMRNAI